MFVCVFCCLNLKSELRLKVLTLTVKNKLNIAAGVWHVYVWPTGDIPSARTPGAVRNGSHLRVMPQ